jgi:hypothetical protein
MNSLSEQDPLNPNDPSYYAPRWLRERAEAGLPYEPAGLARELDRRAALHSVAARFAVAAGVVTVVALFFFIVVPASRQSGASSTSSEITGSVRTAVPQSGQGDGGSKPMVPASQQSDASSTSSEITGSVRTALPQPGQGDGGSKPMVPASQQSDASSTSSEITGSVRTALPQPGQGNGGSKPALAEFQAILAPAPASQPATHEQSQQLLQQFLQWRQKAISTETSQ